jgi:sugar O-acyltransferase (sialic acid O-acetyltransferase NeuD family)
MSPDLLHIAGTGSFAAEIASWARESGIEPGGLIELRDPERVGSTIHGLPVLALDDAVPGASAVIGVGGDRRETRRILAERGWGPAGVVHPRAAVAATAQLAEAITIGPMAVVGAEAEVGEDAILSRGALVGHHVRVGAFCTLNPGCNVGGNSVLGESAFIGIGATVVNGVEIGAGATVAAGAVVVRDVDSDSRVQGVPAAVYAT